MTNPRQHPQQADTTGFAPDDPNHPQMKATQKAMQSASDSQTERDRKELEGKYPDARAIEIDQLVVARGTRRVAVSALDQIGQVRQKQDEHEQRITVLETRPIQVSIAPPSPPPPRAHRGSLHSYSEIDDAEAVSGSVLRAAMQKQKSDQEALERRQSLEIEAQTVRIKAEAQSMLWKPVLATISTIALALIAQYFAARGTITSEVRETTKDAIREAAPAVAKEAARAVEESVQSAPKRENP